MLLPKVSVMLSQNLFYTWNREKGIIPGNAALRPKISCACDSVMALCGPVLCLYS